MPKCENCGANHKRRRFCSNTCKDKFHNRTNPRGFQERTPISKFEMQEKEFDDAMFDATAGWDEGGWLD